MNKIDTTQMLEQAKEAEAAGFLAVAKKLKDTASRVTRMSLAYEFYRVVKEEHVASFNAKLKEKTERAVTSGEYYRSGYASTVCDQLVFTDLQSYEGTPPAEVFGKVKEAQDRKIFDSMEVACVEPVATHVKLPDPIVFGRITGCSDRWFIADWGTDVNIGDLLQRHEG